MTVKQRQNLDRYYQSKYGISLETYEQMREAQGGKCYICGDVPSGKGPWGRPAKLVMDHCHTTGRVRHLLCNRCNPMIGMALENKTRLLQAIEYVENECGVYTEGEAV